MFSKLIISCAILHIFTVMVSAIQWQIGNWAMDCDLPGGDFTSRRTSAEHCGPACATTFGCTHFTFTRYDGGTCWMKTGGGNKALARYKKGAVCGIIHFGPGTDPGPDPGPDDNNKPDGNKPDNNNPGGSLGCDFLFGRGFGSKNDDYSSVDYITLWAGQDEYFNPHWHGDMLRAAKKYNKFGVFYGYIIAFMARREWGLQDCNVPGTNLCERGANYIRAKRNDIVAKYKHYAAESAKIIGRNEMMVWLIEPDFHQYYKDSYQNKKQQGGTLSGQYMRSFFDDIVRAIKSELPNAKISWDISAWIGEQGMREWWGYFASSNQIDFVHTSGGESLAASDRIRPNELQWRVVHQITGKKIIADTGYGVGGGGTGHNNDYDNVNNLRNRIKDGVIAVSQSNPRGDWANILRSVRPQLPKLC